MQTMLPEQGFLGLTEQQSVSYDDAKIVVIPFGLEATVSYGAGTAKGPAAMIKASHDLELFDEELWCEPYKQLGIVTLPEATISKDIVTAINQLEATVEQVLKDGKFPFVFGGEHTITAGSIKPFAAKHQDLVILHFDAHADLRDSYLGEKHSHACALRRCLDDDNLSLLSIGIRNISAEEIPFLDNNRHRINIFWAKDKDQWDIEKILTYLSNKTVYLTFDVDGFDASLMPATGTPEPGGLFWNETIDIIRRASKVCNIVGADINELSPIEQFHSCDFLSAKLAYKIMSFVFGIEAKGNSQG